MWGMRYVCMPDWRGYLDWYTALAPRRQWVAMTPARAAPSPKPGAMIATATPCVNYRLLQNKTLRSRRGYAHFG